MNSYIHDSINRIKLITGINISFSDNSDLGWSEKRKQNEIYDQKMLTNEMNETIVSLAVSSRDSHIIPNLECQKNTHTESSPPDIFNNSSSLKYLHKKFKRVASTVIEDNYIKVTTNVNKIVAECASKFDATVENNVSRESFSAATIVAAANDDNVDIIKSHINKPETNNSHVIEKYLELTNVPAKRDQDLLNNDSVNKNSAVGVDLSGRNCGLAGKSVQLPTKIRATDLSSGLNKSKCDGLFNSASKNTQNTISCESLPDDFRTKTRTGIGERNLHENLVQRTQFNISKLSADISIDSKSVCSSSNIEICRTSVTKKPSTRRKTNERPYQCATCGIELKSKSRLYKHCRFESIFFVHAKYCLPLFNVAFLCILYSRSVNHDMKSGKYSSQLPNEDVDLDISQSASSDLELRSCCATTDSDIVSLQKGFPFFKTSGKIKIT